MQTEQFLSHYGPLALFIGGAVGGPIIVTLGGMLAHQQVLSPWTAFASTGLGSLFANQILYILGRRFRTRAVVIRIAQSPAGARVVNFVGRHPVGYVLTYRFIMGLRSISPLVLGMVGRIGVRRFAIANLLGAALWSAAFVGLGYFSSATIKALLARTRIVDASLFYVALGVAGITILATQLKRLRALPAKISAALNARR